MQVVHRSRGRSVRLLGRSVRLRGRSVRLEGVPFAYLLRGEDVDKLSTGGHLKVGGDRAARVNREGLIAAGHLWRDDQSLRRQGGNKGQRRQHGGTGGQSPRRQRGDNTGKQTVRACGDRARQQGSEETTQGNRRSEHEETDGRQCSTEDQSSRSRFRPRETFNVNAAETAQNTSVDSLHLKEGMHHRDRIRR